jgi:hypothetical protein
MSVVCNCLEPTDTPCVDELDPNDPDSIYYYPPFIYASCHGGSQEDQTFFHCIADQAMLDPLPTCSAAFTTCDPTGGAAGSGG